MSSANLKEINIQLSIVFLFAGNEKSNFKICKENSIYNSTKNAKESSTKRWMRVHWEQYKIIEKN